jgi:hypothetical protein
MRLGCLEAAVRSLLKASLPLQGWGDGYYPPPQWNPPIMLKATKSRKIKSRSEFMRA